MSPYRLILHMVLRGWRNSSVHHWLGLGLVCWTARSPLEIERLVQERLLVKVVIPVERRRAECKRVEARGPHRLIRRDRAVERPILHRDIGLRIVSDGPAFGRGTATGPFRRRRIRQRLLQVAVL